MSSVHCGSWTVDGGRESTLGGDTEGFPFRRSPGGSRPPFPRGPGVRQETAPQDDGDTAPQSGAACLG